MVLIVNSPCVPRYSTKLSQRESSCLTYQTFGLGVQWFGSGAGQDHSGVTCTDSPDCNPAKCHGNTQNNTAKYGDLDCESEPADGLDKHKGSHCLDNLSNAQFYVSTAAGEGKCVDFSSNEAFSRKTFFTQTDPAGQLRDGVISKLTVASVDPLAMYEANGHILHSNGVTEVTTSHRLRYGIISGKRMVCTDSICHVFKVGMCIKCPKQSSHPMRSGPFARTVGLNTMTNIDEFVKCCVMGGKDKDGNAIQYEQGQLSWQLQLSNCDGGRCDCGDHYKHADGSGAFTARNNAGATLKDEYQCWDGTDADVDGKFADTQARGIIKAS